MIPVDFEQSTALLAENQPEYLTLPVYEDHVEVISCWKLTFMERLRILWAGRLWIRQLTFGNPLQPQAPQTENPWR